MKNLLFILIFTPIICLSQDISVKTKVGYLNVRSLPHVDSRILGKLENKTRLIYSDTLVDGWIKIKCNGSKEIIEGWVSVGDLYAPNFKSNILQDIEDVFSEDDIGVGCVINTVDDRIYANRIINLNGVRTILEIESIDNIIIFYNKQISIKVFRLNSNDIAIINYNGIEEIIYVNFMCGC